MLSIESTGTCNSRTVSLFFFAFSHQYIKKILSHGSPAVPSQPMTNQPEVIEAQEKIVRSCEKKKQKKNGMTISFPVLLFFVSLASCGKSP